MNNKRGINEMNLPHPFLARMQELLGEEYERFVQALVCEDNPVSVRLNSGKGVTTIRNARQVPWSGGVGYYLSVRPTFTFDPMFHAGAYYVQEASSMFLGSVIKQYIDRPVRYLDLCAAPGGKSTHALSLLPQGSLVVSNEVVRQRANILAENITKWGSPYSVVTNNMPVDWGRWNNYFDVIATDVPCSGEGMFRKDETAIAEWSLDNVTHCASRQQSILSDVWDALRPGGLLIYSTCTYNVEENECMVQYLVRTFGAEPLSVAIEPQWGIAGALKGDAPVYRFMPHSTQGEGLFMALLRKPGDSDNSCEYPPYRREKKKKQSGKVKPMPIPHEVKQWLKEDADVVFTADETAVTALPALYADDIQAMQRDFNLLHAGIPLATGKGKDFIPTQALALSAMLRREAFTTCEVSLDMALSYLRRESIVLPEGTSRGYVLLTYNTLPLGWVKNLGNRANNLYPQEWRIRSPHNPDVIIDAGVEVR